MNTPIWFLCTPAAPGRTTLERGELLVSIQLPVPRPRSGAGYVRFTPRAEMDIAVVGVGASLELSEDQRTIRAARVALGAVAPTPLCLEAIGVALTGQAPTESTWNVAATMAQEAARPISDVRGATDQRVHLVGVLTRRALRKADIQAKREVNRVAQN
jgi:xanthine dehydrogenase FAD-binding subunit